MFRIKLFRPIDYMTNRLRLVIEIGRLELELEFGIIVTLWRYCKLCKGILEDDGCDNPRCSNYQQRPKHYRRSLSIPAPEPEERVTARRSAIRDRITSQLAAANDRLPAAGEDRTCS